MKIQIIVAILILFAACTKNSNDRPLKLLREEATDNYGNVFHREYSYDNLGRINSITQYENMEQPSVAVTISYSDHAVILVSAPKTDPVYHQNSQVILTLDANGRTQQRIESTHGVAISSAVQPAETFRYDTMIYVYDATGALKKTMQSRYDSNWVDASYNSITRLSSTGTYTTIAGNLTAFDELVVYPKTIRQAGITILAGGTSEHHTVFSYTKTYANRIDFTNAAVLNEYRLYYEAPLNSYYKNLPDQSVGTETDKDINGALIFSGNSVVDIERRYNASDLLSSVHISTLNTPYAVINYFYSH